MVHKTPAQSSASRPWRWLLLVTGIALILFPPTAYALLGPAALVASPALLCGTYIIVIAAFADRINGTVKLLGLELPLDPLRPLPRASADEKEHSQATVELPASSPR